jgi:hypothetical protein
VHGAFKHYKPSVCRAKYTPDLFQFWRDPSIQK